MFKHLLFALFLLAVILCYSANGQLRIVNYNVAEITNSGALTTVLNAIKDEQVNGISKPIDVLVLNEVESPNITTILGILNSQGVGTYVAGTWVQRPGQAEWVWYTASKRYL